MNKDSIPKAPNIHSVESKVTERLNDWKNYFEALSPRIKILEQDDGKFKEKLDLCREKSRELLNLDDKDRIIDWPKHEEVAFIIIFDSNVTGGDKPCYLSRNCFVFTINDRAFGLGYFSWNGDGETDPDNHCYSLNDFYGDALSWTYIATKVIRKRIKKLEESIPPPPPKQ